MIVGGGGGWSDPRAIYAFLKAFKKQGFRSLGPRRSGGKGFWTFLFFGGSDAFVVYGRRGRHDSSGDLFFFWGPSDPGACCAIRDKHFLAAARALDEIGGSIVPTAPNSVE